MTTNTSVAKTQQKARERAKEWYYQNRERAIARIGRWNKEHHQHRQEYERLWRLRHLERMRLSRAKWRAAHPDYHRDYARTHKRDADKLNVKRQRRRARIAALPNTLTIDQWKAIKEAYNNRCAYCSKRNRQLVMEHVVPISKGGGTTPDNIVPSCTPCNAAKGDREAVVIPPIRLLL